LSICEVEEGKKEVGKAVMGGLGDASLMPREEKLFQETKIRKGSEKKDEGRGEYTKQGGKHT